MAGVVQTIPSLEAIQAALNNCYKQEQEELVAELAIHPSHADCKEEECYYCCMRDCPKCNKEHYNEDGCPECTHPSLEDCDEKECEYCGMRDCPTGNYQHYYRDGCPDCGKLDKMES